MQNNTLTDTLYPLVFAIDSGGVASPDSLDLSFDILCMDLVDKGEEIENEVKSDTLQMLLDLVAYLKKLQDANWYFMEVSKTSTLSSFTEKLDDELTGWKISITLKQPLSNVDCAIPYDGAGMGSIECEPVTITDSDGVTIVEVASGGNFTCTSRPLDLEINLNFLENTNKTSVLITEENKGVITQSNLTNTGNLTISTDDITYTTLTYPLTLVSGVTYYFERSNTSSIGVAQLLGYADAIFEVDNSINDLIVTDGLIQHLVGGIGVSGSNWSDQTSNGNDADLVNTPIINNDNIELDGINDYVDLPLSSTPTLTMSVVLELITLTSSDRMLQGISGINNIGLNLSYNGGYLYHYNGTLFQSTGVKLTTGVKYMLSIVRSSSDTKIYINTSLELTQIHSNSTNSTFANVGIGNKLNLTSGNNANAKIYDFKFYNRDLSQLELTQNFNTI